MDSTDAVGGWIEAELFAFALGCLRQALVAACVLCDEFDNAAYTAIVHTFDLTVPAAGDIRNRLMHFDEWDLQPGHLVTMARFTDGALYVQVSRSDSERSKDWSVHPMVLDIRTAAEAAAHAAAAATRRLLQLRVAESQRR